MKKIGMISFFMIQSIITVAMDSAQPNVAQIKKMEIVRRIFRNQRNTADMSLDSNSQTEDDMSWSGSLSDSRSSSGSFPIPIPREIVQEKLSNCVRSKQGRTPRQREFPKQLQNLVNEQERREKEMPFLTFEIFLMHFE